MFQFHIAFRTVVGQEDCLLLSVYTPEIKPDALKPVYVWIHGGGFVGGSGNKDLYGPERFMDYDIVNSCAISF